MAAISVKERIAAPLEAVFAAVTDHVGFVRAPGTTTRILQPGSPEANGLGCVREVRVSPGMRFVEEITAWQPPAAYEYTIRESTLPLEHHGSRLSLREQDGVTEVEWSGSARVTVPVLGGLLQRVLDRALGRSFAAMLGQAKQQLERGGS